MSEYILYHVENNGRVTDTPAIPAGDRFLAIKEIRIVNLNQDPGDLDEDSGLADKVEEASVNRLWVAAKGRHSFRFTL